MPIMRIIIINNTFSGQRDKSVCRTNLSRVESAAWLSVFYSRRQGSATDYVLNAF